MGRSRRASPENRPLSGPTLDRIDLYSNVHEVHHDKLLTQTVHADTDEMTRQRIINARVRQQARFDAPSKLNADMTNTALKRWGHLEDGAAALLNTAAQRMQISARSYMRAAKVARTIADLESSAAVTADHISEALAYRRQPNME